MVNSTPSIEAVLRDEEGPVGCRSAFESGIERFADLRAGSFYTGNDHTSTTRPFNSPHKEKTRLNVGPGTYDGRWEKQRPRSVSPNFSKLVPRGDCFELNDKSVEALFRDTTYTHEADARQWRRTGSKFSRSPQRGKPKKRGKRVQAFNPDRGSQGCSKYQSMASAASAGKGGSPQKYSYAFRGTGRSSGSSKLETSRKRAERESRERLGPGAYDSTHSSQLFGSVRRAQSAGSVCSSMFTPLKRDAHDAPAPAVHKNPGPGEYDAATSWREHVAPRTKRGEVRLERLSTGAGGPNFWAGGLGTGAGKVAATLDASVRSPARGDDTWSLNTDARRWRKQGGSAVGAFSPVPRITRDLDLSYKDVPAPSLNVSSM